MKTKSAVSCQSSTWSPCVPILVLCLVGFSTACAAASDTETEFDAQTLEPDGQTEDTDFVLGEAEQALTFTGVRFDTSGRCTVAGLRMHCCGPNEAMIGVHLDDGVWKCAGLPMVGTPVADVRTIRNGMHACPVGALMIGFHEDRDILACQFPARAVSFEFVDTSSRDSYPMHVCRDGGAMAGIHVDNDDFTCLF